MRAFPVPGHAPRASDHEALPKITRQPIGIVAQNIPEIAAATVRALLKQIRDPNLIGQAETIRIPTSLHPLLFRRWRP